MVETERTRGKAASLQEVREEGTATGKPKEEKVGETGRNAQHCVTLSQQKEREGSQ